MRGTAALAIPANEQRRLSGTNRRIFKTDGVPLGAQRREAALKFPPTGSMSAR